MTDEQMRDLVKECGLDWQRGYMPLFGGDPTNRYAVLIEAVEERLRAALAEPQAEPQPVEVPGLTDEQIIQIGRLAMDKCYGTEAQHIYIAREVLRRHMA